MMSRGCILIFADGEVSRERVVSCFASGRPLAHSVMQTLNDRNVVTD